MGTSTSNSGPGSNVSLDPTWLDDIPKETQSPLERIAKEDLKDIQLPIPTNIIAPTRRFAATRKDFASYLRTGNRESFKKALGHYSREGMGGVKNVVKRLSASTAVGAGLYSLLSGIKTSSNQNVRDWINSLKEQDLKGQDLIDEIVRVVVNDGGSLDEESYKDSINQSLSELLDKVDDIFNLTENEIWSFIVSFISNEAYNRIVSDIGQKIERPSGFLVDNVARMEEMRDYLHSDIGAQIDECRKNNKVTNKSDVKKILDLAIEHTFIVYEGEL